MSLKLGLVEIRTFVGSSVGWAEHYSGTLYIDNEEITLEYQLNKSQAKKMSEPDFKWNVGDTTSRFFSEKDLLLKLVEVAKDHKLDIVVNGSLSTCQAQPIVYNTNRLSGLTKKLNNLYEQCEALGFWDRPENEAKVEKLNKQWVTLAYSNSIANKYGGIPITRQRKSYID